MKGRNYRKHSTAEQSWLITNIVLLFWLPRLPEWRWGWEVASDGYGVSLWGDENVLKLNGDIGGTTLWIYYNPLNYTLEKGEFYKWMIAKLLKNYMYEAYVWLMNLISYPLRLFKVEKKNVMVVIVDVHCSSFGLCYLPLKIFNFCSGRQWSCHWITWVLSRSSLRADIFQLR